MNMNRTNTSWTGINWEVMNRSNCRGSEQLLCCSACWPLGPLSCPASPALQRRQNAFRLVGGAVAGLLSYQLGSAVATEQFKVGRGDDGSFARTIYLIAIVMTVSSAFGSVVSVFIAAFRGEESLWLLLPGTLWLGLLLLCGLLIL